MNKAKYISGEASDAEVANQTGTVTTSLAGNPNYTGATMTALLTSMQDKRDEYLAALPAATYGGRAEKAAKNTAKEALVNAAKLVCDEVNRMAAGNRDKLLTSGFKVGAAHVSPIEMEPLKKFTVENTLTLGQIITKVTKGKGTVYVLIEYAIAPTLAEATQWTVCPDTVTKCVISGLTSGTRVWVRATSIGRRGQKLHAPAITTIVM